MNKTTMALIRKAHIRLVSDLTSPRLTPGSGSKDSFSSLTWRRSCLSATYGGGNGRSAEHQGGDTKYGRTLGALRRSSNVYPETQGFSQVMLGDVLQINKPSLFRQLRAFTSGNQTLMGSKSLILDMNSPPSRGGDDGRSLATAEGEGVGGRRVIDGPRILQERHQLHHARRIAVKLGTKLLTHGHGRDGLALGPLASIVEQVAKLQNEGRELLIITSGAVAFGKQKMAQELLMSLSMRETLSQKRNQKAVEVMRELPPRSSAAIGQPGLMTLYEAMFAQYGVKVAQILLTKADMQNSETQANLISTIDELLSLNILPIINGNDAVVHKTHDIGDNDSLSAVVAAETKSDLLIIVTDENGIYDKSPKLNDSRIISSFNPEQMHGLSFGDMDSKVRAATTALKRGTTSVICNGMLPNVMQSILDGKKIGTLFTTKAFSETAVEVLAKRAREGCRLLQSLPSKDRASAIETLASLLDTRQADILAANTLDLEEKERSGMSHALTSRLALTPAKLSVLATGLRQIARDSVGKVGHVLKRTLLAKDIELTQVTVPIGVLLVIFESCPDALPQVAALAMATGNGLLLKGGKETSHSNRVLMDLVNESLNTVGAPGAIYLITTREEISDLLKLEGYIDLVIPRGSSELVKSIKEQSQAIPVLGHAEGICHVYVDKYADLDKAINIAVDAKCDHPSACNAMDTLLIHEDLFHNTEFFIRMCRFLHENGVSINAGPLLANSLTFTPPLAKSLRTEYGNLECTIEVVKNIDKAIDHIHRYGSAHTDVIITEDQEAANHFLQAVDSACVFHNCSSRFSDGYHFGLGAEVGVSTARIHARGPVGIDGLLTTKWVIKAKYGVAADFTEGRATFLHQKLDIDQDTY